MPISLREQTLKRVRALYWRRLWALGAADSKKQVPQRSVSLGSLVVVYQGSADKERKEETRESESLPLHVRVGIRVSLITLTWQYPRKAPDTVSASGDPADYGHQNTKLTLIH